MNLFITVLLNFFQQIFNEEHKSYTGKEAYGVIRQFFNEQLEESEKGIVIKNYRKEFIKQNLQNDSENKILTILENEKHSKIIDFLNIN